MDIAAMSVVLSHARVRQQAGLAVMKMAMDASKAEAGMVTEMAGTSGFLEYTIRPHLGGNIDIRL